jgi:hypothetical protein
MLYSDPVVGKHSAYSASASTSAPAHRSRRRGDGSAQRRRPRPLVRALSPGGPQVAPDHRDLPRGGPRVRPTSHPPPAGHSTRPAVRTWRLDRGAPRPRKPATAHNRYRGLHAFYRLPKPHGEDEAAGSRSPGSGTCSTVAPGRPASRPFTCTCSATPSPTSAAASAQRDRPHAHRGLAVPGDARPLRRLGHRCPCPRCPPSPVAERPAVAHGRRR